MLPLHQTHKVQDAPRPAQQLDGPTRGVLNALRVLALECRAAARADIFKACALLAGERDVARDAHARALLRCLDQAIGRAPVFHRPGEVSLSFDEAWLIRAITSAQGNDWHSFTFLLRSRIPFSHRRNIAFLINGIADRFRTT